MQLLSSVSNENPLDRGWSFESTPHWIKRRTRMEETYRKKYIEGIARKLRETEKEYGRGAMAKAVIIDCLEIGEQICGKDYIHAPTMAGPILGNVKFKVSRFFENI